MLHEEYAFYHLPPPLAREYFDPLACLKQGSGLLTGDFAKHSYILSITCLANIVFKSGYASMRHHTEVHVSFQSS